MSAFDAGSILGHLGLDISEYGKGILEAQGLNELFPESVATFLENPLLGLIDMAKEAGEALVDFVGDAIHEVSQQAIQMSLSAERAGTSIEFMSEMGAVAKSAGVDVGSMGAAFKALQKNASDAVEQGGPALKYWQEIGISQQDLKASMGDSAQLFQLVKTHLDELSNATERNAAAQHLLARGGSEIIPLINESNDAMQEAIDIQKALRATEDEESAKSALGWNRLGVAFDEAWEGIKKSLADPILEYFSANSEQLIGTLIDNVQDIENDIGETMDFVFKQNGPQLLAWIQETIDLSTGLVHTIDGIIEGVSWFLSNAGAIMEIAGAVALLINPLAGAALIAGGIAYQGLGAPNMGSGDIHVHANIQMDPEATASEVARHLIPPIKAAHAKQQKQVKAAAHNKLVAANVGGNG